MIKEEKKTESFRRQLELAKRIENVRTELEHHRSQPLQRLIHSSYMHSYLKSYGVVEAKDSQRKTAGVMVEPELFSSIFEYIDLLESQLERTSFRDMVESRKDDTGFVSGNQLIHDALDVFDKNEAEIRRFLDADN